MIFYSASWFGYGMGEYANIADGRVDKPATFTHGEKGLLAGI